MKDTIAAALKHWIPYKLTSHQDAVLFDWLYTGTETYTEPFFDGTIGKCLQYRKTQPPNKHLSTADALIEWSHSAESIEPTAFVFHVSRCGSTLVSQALGLAPDFISLSEVPVFDSILRLRYNSPYPSQYVDELLKAAIIFYGSRRTGTEKHLFIKTDSWHLMFYEQLRRLYPNTPFFIIYRKPGEVLQSNRRKSGMQGCYGIIEPELLGLQNVTEEQTHPDIYMQLVLEKYFEAIADISKIDGNTFLLNYQQGLPELMQQLADFCGIGLSAQHRERIIQRGKYHAKHPDEQFTEALDTIAINGPYISRLNNLYHQAEALRQDVARRTIIKQI